MATRLRADSLGQALMWPRLCQAVRPGLLTLALAPCLVGRGAVAAHPGAGPWPDGSRWPAHLRGLHFETRHQANEGPGPNDWDRANVSLHPERGARLRIAPGAAGNWTCAELITSETVGYGTYTWSISGDFDQWHRRVVLGMFIYRDDEHEMDVEISKWFSESGLNGQFAVQPVWRDYDGDGEPEPVADPARTGQPGKRHLFSTGAHHELTFRLRWTPRRVEFAGWAGREPADGDSLWHWTYRPGLAPDADIPNAELGGYHADMNLWLFRGGDGYPLDRLEPTEVWVHDFTYEPLASPPNAPPRIRGIETGPAAVRPGETVRLRCEAQDPDADPLRYFWSAVGGGGELEVAGQRAVWRAPTRSGRYSIACEVRDPVGDHDVGRIAIDVR